MDFTEVKLKKLASSAVGDIFEGITHNFYDVKDPSFSEKERSFAEALIKIIQGGKGPLDVRGFEGLSKDFSDELRDEVISVVEMNNLLETLPSKKTFVLLAGSLEKLISKVRFISNKSLFAEYVLHNSIGLKQLAFFSLDEDLEELMINGLDVIFVFHKKYGMCRTNVVFDEKVLDNIIQKVAHSVGKDFSTKSPLLDARLPDGSRVNATIGDVSSQGISMTIRKFAPIPLTILDLIENNTLTSEAAAFLWMMVDGFGVTPQNIIITGSTASGKTTFLNVLSNFSRLGERVVSIEDTLELSLLGRDNWVAFEARHFANEEVTMDDLLLNSLRMRPDRIIVGEVRGSDALTLFTAMDNGQEGCMGTIHSNDARECVLKLQEKPLEVPTALIPLVDLIIVMRRHYSKTKGMERRVIQVAEVSRMETKVLLSDIFDFDESKGKIKRTEIPSGVIEKMAQRNSLSKNELKSEIATRQLVLEWMISKGIRAPLEVLEVIQSYYYDSQKVLRAIKED